MVLYTTLKRQRRFEFILEVPFFAHEPVRKIAAKQHSLGAASRSKVLLLLDSKRKTSKKRARSAAYVKRKLCECRGRDGSDCEAETEALLERKYD